MGSNEAKLSWSEKLGYGLGGMTMAITVSLGTYLTVYFTNTALLDIGVISTILAVSRIFDGISDILVGNLIDKTKTIHGKARVWLRRISLPLAVSAILLFFVPKSWPDGVRYVYVFLTYNLFTSVFVTFFIVSHNALLPLITSDHREHRQISSIAGFFQRGAFMLVQAFFVKLLMVFTSEPGNAMTQKGFTFVVAILGFLAAGLCIAEFCLTREKAGTVGLVNPEKKDKTVFLTDLKMLLKNKYWIIMLIATGLNYFAASSFDGAMSYYTIYVMGDFEAMSYFSLVMGIAGIATTIVLIFLGPKIRPSKLFIIAMTILTLGIFGIFLANTKSRAVLIVSLICVGMGTGAVPVSMQALITEILFYSQKTTGKLIPGLGNACMNATRKLGLGLSVAAFGFIMARAGFDAKLDEQAIAQPDSVIGAINIGFFWIPIAFYTVIVIIFLLFFDMDKKSRQK